MALAAFFADQQPVPGHRPWPRYRLDRAQWLKLVEALEDAPWTLIGLWGEPAQVHAAFREEPSTIAVASLDCAEGRFPSLAKVRPGAARLERAVRDLVGLEPEGLEDGRPWLDHGRWPLSHPLAATPGPAEAMTDAGANYRFLPVEGDGLHQIPVGPVHAGIIEPGHFRFTANGETVVRLEQRLGYVHKGVESLIAGKPVAEAARIACRLSGDSTVAQGWAFAAAVEAATGTEVPPRAVHLRAIKAELERIANHLGDFGAICNDAAFVALHMQCGVLREQVLRAAGAVFGHRLMMDRVVPGGVGIDLDAGAVATLLGLIETLARRLPPLVQLYDGKPSLLDRTVTTGHTRPDLVQAFGAGGHVGRAAGRNQDARAMPGYAPYDRLTFKVPVLTEGDVNARVWIRLREIDESLDLLRQLLGDLPAGPIVAPVPPASGEGMALVEAFRGETLAWVRIEAGRVARGHLRDASWFQWPLLEHAILDNIVADFPLCNKSFNCSYSGHDL